MEKVKESQKTKRRSNQKASVFALVSGTGVVIILYALLNHFLMGTLHWTVLVLVAVALGASVALMIDKILIQTRDRR